MPDQTSSTAIGPPRVRVELSLASDRYAPEHITAVVGREPTRTATKGLARRPGAPPSVLNLWLYQRAETATYDVDREVARLLDDLAGNSEALRDAIERLGLRAWVSCTVWLGESTPALAFEPALLHRIASLPAGLDVDLYL